jgi:sugar lactone lactonase YvrE
MKTLRHIFSCFLLVFVLFSSTQPTLAQKRGNPEPTPAPARVGASLDGLTLGKPGTSFSYSKEFGIKDSFYIEDTSHLNYPSGVFATNDGVWVVEAYGMRALKFNKSGAFQTKIGQAGHRYLQTPNQLLSIESLSDAAVDSDGNLWLANSDVSTVLEFGADGTYKKMLGKQYSTVGSSAGNDVFNHPEGIAFDSSKRIYISDQNNHRVQVFNPDGSYLATIGVTGIAGSDDSHFTNPHRITIDSDNLLYVPDDNFRVQIINVTNPQAPIHVATLGVSGQQGEDNNHFNSPHGVAVDGNFIYVADTWCHRVQIFNRATRAYTATLGENCTAGSTNDHFSSPYDVSVDTAGNLYVADNGNMRVQVFNSAQQYVRTLGTTGVPYLTDNQHFNRPSGVAVDHNGNIFLVEEAGQRLIKLNPDGSVVWAVGVPGVNGYHDTSNNSRWNFPNDLALAPDGRIYLADTNRIQIFNPDGSYNATIGKGWGTGSDQFGYVPGVFVAKDGKVYVADAGNQRVQIFNPDSSYLATMGETGVSGQDNSHFTSPRDVVVDTAGNIYVADDESNHRVQVFNSQRQYLRTLGVTGQSSNEYGYFCGPSYLAPDGAGNLYVASSWNSRIFIFDPNGALLTGLGGFGSRPSELANVSALAIGTDGSLYAADYDHARVVKFTRGYPRWVQVNINGFGSSYNNSSNMVVYRDHLYVPGGNDQADLWRLDANGGWGKINPDGLSAPQNWIEALFVYQDRLYVSVAREDANWNYLGGSLLRFDGSSWTPVVSGGLGSQMQNESINQMREFNNQLYATTYMYDNTNQKYLSPQIWRSSSGDAGTWEKTVDFASAPYNWQDTYSYDLYAFNGALYLVTSPASTAPMGSVWRSTDGTTWTQVSDPGFGNVPGVGSDANFDILALTGFKGYLYAGVRRYGGSGAQLWRCQLCSQQSDWQKVVGGGFNSEDRDGDGTIDNYRIESFVEYDGYLYAAAANVTTGMQIWRSADGLHWEQAAANGFGVSNTQAAYWHAGAVFDDQLFFGGTNYTLGMQIWEFLSRVIYLPAVQR